MTLLDNLKYFLKPGLAFMLIPFFFACNDPNELGLELEPEENPFNLGDTTITLSASTVYLDSLRTDQFDYITAFGKYQDSIYGEVTAISYNQYNVFGGTIPDNDSLEYHSTNIILRIDAIRSSSLLNQQEINIYRASDTLYRQGVYLASRSTPYNTANPVANHSFDLSSDSLINIPLSDPFGAALYNRLELAATDDDYQDSLTNNSFVFDPLVFVPGEDNDALFSFDFTPDTVGIYVNMINTYTGDISSFSFDFRDAHYVEIQRDISTSQKLSNMNADFEESDTPSSRTYLDMLAGVYTKIDLQPLLNFIESQDNLLVNLAQVSLGVANVNEPGFQPAKPPIQFYFVKEDEAGAKSINASAIQLALAATSSNNLELAYRFAFPNVLLSESSYLNFGSQPLTLRYDTANVNYSGNITLFTQAQADQYESSGNFLTKELLVLSSDPLGLGQISFQKPEIQVTIYYTTLNN